MKAEIINRIKENIEKGDLVYVKDTDLVESSIAIITEVTTSKNYPIENKATYTAVVLQGAIPAGNIITRGQSSIRLFDNILQLSN